MPAPPLPLHTLNVHEVAPSPPSPERLAIPLGFLGLGFLKVSSRDRHQTHRARRAESLETEGAGSAQRVA